MRTQTQMKSEARCHLGRAYPLARAGLIVLMLTAAWPRVAQLAETRIFRDVLGITPFGEVAYQIIGVTDFTVTVSGSFVKYRDCETVGDVMIVITDDGRSDYGWFENLELKHTPVNRPVVDTPQRFGPWVFHSPIWKPDYVAMLRTHSCDGELQTNTVMQFRWPKTKYAKEGR